ncbi:hypothetical protein NIES4074_46870 [Cylindrospermum sp. NIES-4074]|nr:hypothetical protein NIES4074_46870 [Cylindrospermum sp. NIES-4074]
MYSREHRTAKKSSDFHNTPVTNQFAPRPFVVQPQTKEVKPQQEQTDDLQTKAEKINEVSDGFPDPAVFTRHLTPPKTPRVQMKLYIPQRGEKSEQEAEKVGEEVVQGQSSTSGDSKSGTGKSQENKTGMPDNLKAGIENLSGMSLDDVKVHYNSAKPAEMQAKAYTQGTEIHVGTGQEEHLAHEAWHVVQQKQGRVKPTLQAKGVEINDDEGLEKEADVMGHKAQQAGDLRLVGNISGLTPSSTPLQLMMQSGVSSVSGFPIIQRYGDKMAMGYENLAKEEEGIQKLQTGIKKIYDEQKQQKQAARDQLDEDYKQQSANLEEKQNYLIAALKYVIFQKLNTENVVQSGFLAQRDSAQKENNKTVLNVPVKQQLDQQAESLSDELIGQIKVKMLERQTSGKTINKAAWVSKVTEYARDYGRHKIADPIVQGYEQGYKNSAMNRKKLLKAWVEFCDPLGFDLMMVTADNEGKVIVNPKDDQEREIHIATVYFDEKRFIKVDEVRLNKNTPQEEKREIFAHRESNDHYVQDAFGSYVKRYVKRALNEYDNPSPDTGVSINSDPRKKKDTTQSWSQIAAAVPTMTQEQQAEEIRNHQRAKELQGGSPFISFTTTDRPIFGSSAKPFEGPHGVATVDLAQISKNRVFDTHTSKAMKQIHNVDDPNPNMPFVEKDDAVERNSAARDAMRTREVVVAGDIPNNAITAVKAEGKDYVKGPSGKFQPRQQALLAYLRLLSGPVIDDVD